MSLAGFGHGPSMGAGWSHRASAARFPPARAACQPLVSCADVGNYRFPCRSAVAHPVSIWPGRMGQFVAFSLQELDTPPRRSATVSARATRVLGRLQDQAPWYPAGPWSLRALACIPPPTAAAALWTFTFPLLKLKTRHITKLRAPKISGGKHYWEQKPGGLFFRGWLLFQSVLASIFFPSTGILGYWGA